MDRALELEERMLDFRRGHPHEACCTTRHSFDKKQCTGECAWYVAERGSFSARQAIEEISKRWLADDFNNRNHFKRGNFGGCVFGTQTRQAAENVNESN